MSTPMAPANERLQISPVKEMIESPEFFLGCPSPALVLNLWLQIAKYKLLLKNQTPQFRYVWKCSTSEGQVIVDTWPACLEIWDSAVIVWLTAFPFLAIGASDLEPTGVQYLGTLQPPLSLIRGVWLGTRVHILSTPPLLTMSSSAPDTHSSATWLGFSSTQQSVLACHGTRIGSKTISVCHSE